MVDSRASKINATPGAAIAGILAILSFSFVATVPFGTLAQNSAPTDREDDTLQSGSRALLEGDSTAAPLNGDPTAIEMSDVVLFRNGDPTDRVVRAAPTSIDSLGIYFELYHPSYGDDDLVHYEIQYAVEVRSRRSPFSGILGRPSRKTVTGSVRHSGGSSTIKEQILLDLVGADESDVVELNVTATDLITGRSKARSISVSSPDRKNTSRAGTRN